jgi:hypothetical protein
LGVLLALEFEAFPGDAALGAELLRELLPLEPAFACLIRPLLAFEFEELVLDEVLLFEAVLLDAPGVEALELLWPLEPGVGLVADGVVLYRRLLFPGCALFGAELLFGLAPLIPGVVGVPGASGGEAPGGDEFEGGAVEGVAVDDDDDDD